MNLTNLIPGFRPRDKGQVTLKGTTPGDDFYVDEKGRHLIFRTIGGRVRPMRVGAEDYAEWLAKHDINIDPADQKTLREIDKELEIMEKAAEYGGAALQKQYEDYFKKRRELYGQVASPYYQQAVEKQAKENNLTTQQVLDAKQKTYEKFKDDVIDRRSDENRGWDSAFLSWVEYQDKKNGLDPSKDNWYYNRVYGMILNELIETAKAGNPLSDLDFGKIFSDEFLYQSVANHYAEYFGNRRDLDPKKVVSAVKTLQKDYRENTFNNRKLVQNYISYWYDRMHKDFAASKEMELNTSSSESSISDVPQDVVPESLPDSFIPEEAQALVGVYNSSLGSKLNSAHRVLLHGLGRIIDSIPVKSRVPVAVELSHAKSGLHALHKEGYRRAYQNQMDLGFSEDRDDLVKDALSVLQKAASGNTQAKVSAMKKVAMIMGIMDGAATLNSNPGIQEANFTRKWHDTAVNAGRVKSEGPGLIDVLLDDQKRSSHIFPNSELKVVHVPKQGAAPVDASEDAEEPEEEESHDVGETFTFVGNRLVSSTGFSAKFNMTTSGYAEVEVFDKEGSPAFDTRVYMPPIPLDDMTEADRSSFLGSIKDQLSSMMEQYKKFSGRTDIPDMDDAGIASVDDSGGKFRVPLFDFKSNLTHEDRTLLGDISSFVEDRGLVVNKVSPFIYRISGAGRDFDLVFNNAKKQVLGAFRDSDGKIVPVTTLTSDYVKKHFSGNEQVDTKEESPTPETPVAEAAEEERVTPESIGQGEEDRDTEKDKRVNDLILPLVLKKGKVVFSKKSAIDYALDNPRWNVEVLETGSVAVVGVFSEGKWFGKPPK